ncbi:putative calcium-transporting ATPase 13, plasma membrane-type [Asimina triloba]
MSSASNPSHGGDCAKHLLGSARNKSAFSRWRIAYATIRSIRAMLSLAQDILAKKNPAGAKLLSTISFVAIQVDDDDADADFLFGIDKNTLAHIVKARDLDSLRRFGGVEAIAEYLECDAEKGIAGKEGGDLGRRRSVFGSNTYLRQPPKNFLRFLLEVFKDQVILILLVCAGLSIAFGIKEDGVKEGWYDGGSIFIAVFLVVVVTAVSNFRQDWQFRKLSDESSDIAVDVVRDGRRQKVSIFDVVVGDVVCLNIGDQIPADGLFLDGHSLQVDESSMTGESDHVDVDGAENPFLFSGTKVADGYARMLITSVGISTTWGEMMSSISREVREETPLQARLNRLTSYIGKIGLSVAAVVLVIMLARYFAGRTTDDDGNREFYAGKTKTGAILNKVADIFAGAVTIVVVAIPEGLPLAVTLTLAYSMKRMMADQAMVRRLSACETMGSATTICTDKTGTLTMNQMKVDKFLFDERLVEIGAARAAANVLELLHQAVGLNTTGSVYRADPASEPEFSGSPTEKAIIAWAVLEMGMDMELLKRRWAILHVEAFNSEKKRSGVLVRKNDEQSSSVHVHWKGAAEMILAMCSNYCDGNGCVKAMDMQMRMQIQRTIETMAAQSLRCIALAHKQIADVGAGSCDRKLPEDGLTLLGMVGLKDPCRPGVRTAVDACRRAGVAVKMITGDNLHTARAIALECGILRADQDLNEAVIEGQEFRSLTTEQRMAIVDKISVMARSSPFDKLLMVKSLKQKGQVVAVTGDGTNDAPALKESDIGLSMGIQGTEVAKESSDIVILDDNFTSVVTVLQWGRCVYNNIQKFIQFQLTVNVAALVINFVAAVSSGDVPLTAVQLLWVNLIMDTLGALALATERPTRELMDQKPVGRTAPLITNVMWRNLTAQALYQVAILLTMQFKGELIFGVNRKVRDTMIFNSFVLCQVFNEFNARKLEKKNVFEGIHRNRLFVGIVAGTVVLQVVMVEFLKRFADTERLNWGQWGACVGIAAASWPIGWLVKCIPVPPKPFFSYLKKAWSLKF